MKQEKEEYTKCKTWKNGSVEHLKERKPEQMPLPIGPCSHL